MYEPLSKSLIFLALEARDVDELVKPVMARLEEFEWLAGEVRDRVEHKLHHRLETGPDQLENAVAIWHEPVRGLDAPITLLVKLEKAAPIEVDGVPTRFLWILLADASTHPKLSSATEFVSLMDNPDFRRAADQAHTREQLLFAYERFLAAQLDFDVVPEELRPTGRVLGGVMADVRRRLPHYGSDFADGLSMKVLASIFFLFFACVAPAVAFGGLVTVLTDGTLGVIEMMTATAICGLLYALLSGQPLTIIGSTGPIIIFIGLLYSVCVDWGLPFLPVFCWVGLWTMVLVLVMAALDVASWIRYFTRFTDEIFAALISLIFIYEAVKDIIKVFNDPGTGYATALLSLVLALGTYILAINLSRFRQSPYLRPFVREFLADFGPTIALLCMSAVAFSMHEVELKTLAVPSEFGTTSGRPWFIDPREAPVWIWFASLVPAILVSILVFLDQNITVRLVNNPEYKLKKGAGYHLDLGLVGLLIGFCSLFGLPWMVAATVRSLNHVRSLANFQGARVVGVVENRVSGVGIHLLIGASLAILPLLQLVPMSVLFGLFLYMGVASLAGNQLFERMKLWFMDPERYPATYYLRAVPARVVHTFTVVQVASLATLWWLKSSRFGIVFPLFIACLAPIRMSLRRFLKPEHLALLDAEEQPSEEALRETD